MFPIVVLGAAVLLQLAAAILAIRLIGLTGVSRAWLLLSLAIFAMVVRRILSLYGVWAGDAGGGGGWPFELVGLAISVLMLAGIASIAPLFDSLRRSQETLRESQRRLTTLLRNLPGMAYRCRNDAARSMEFVSEGAWALTGYPPGELLAGGSHPYLELIHPDDREAVQQWISHALAQRRRHRMVYRIIGADGSEKWVWEQGVGIFSAQGDVTAIEGFVTDVTEKQQADRRSEHLNAVLRAIRNVNQAIARERERERLLQSICDSLVETRGYRYAWIVLLDAAGQPTDSAQAGVGDEFAALLQRLRRGQPVACIREALACSGVFAVEDRQAVCDGCDVHVRVSGQTPIVVRLGWGEQTYGVMLASLPAEYARDDEERELLAEVAGDIAFALHNLDLEQDRRRAEDSLRLEQARLEALLKLNQMTDAPLQTVTDFGLEEAVRLTQSDLGYLAFTSEDESVLTMHAWSKSAMQECAIIDKPIHYPVATTGLWGEAVRQRRAVITNDYAAPNPLKKGHPEGHVPVLRHMNVPVFDGERIVAVIGVGNKKQPYDESDVRQLTLLGEGMWRLIRRREVQEELRRARDELEVRVRVRTAELANANDELQQERYLLHSLMDNLPHNIYFKDPESRFVRINAAMARAFGLQDPAQAVGKTDRDFFTGEHASQALADEREIVRSGRPVIDKEEKETWPDGHATWASTTKMPLRDEAGEIVGTFGLSPDVTEQKLAAEALRDAKEAAEAASRAKSTFLANMSHEIRTPLTAVIGMTDLVLNTPLSAQQREYLSTVKDSGEALLSVINDILDFSKIEAGKLVLERSAFDLRESLGDTMKSLAIRAHQKDLELAFCIHPPVPRRVVGDYNRLRQIIINLVGNALKFTEQGEVVLEVDREALSEREVLLHFKVTDTGIGIPADKLAAVFGQFEQADSALTRRYGGTGLGLAIVSRLAGMMGGRAWVESEVGKGSCFHVTTRLELAEAGDTEDMVLVPACLHGLRVLVVDDTATNRRILDEILRCWQMEPTLARNASNALDLLRTSLQAGAPYRLVLTDAHMPDVDGFMLTESMRQDPALAATKVIMLTSGDRPEDAAHCERLGIANYLLKPVKQSELLESIERTLGVLVPKAELSRTSPQTPPATPLRILLAEDSVVNQKLAVALLTRQGHAVTIANNGKEAVAAAACESFDLILMDIQMPEMDGLEATAAIRAQEIPAGRHTPIIAMTAHALKGDRERCLEAGMDGYVTKPIRPQDLYQAVAAAAIR